jgi:8-oxo-dGTP pyrophosphatase MutT (NUDIX family)
MRVTDPSVSRHRAPRRVRAYRGPVPDDHRHPDPPGQPETILPAATVVLLRDGPDGLETLLLRRNTRLVFAGGHWVFPGGRIEPSDLDGTDTAARLAALDDPARLIGDPGLTAAARRAAVREAHEETGLALDGDELVYFAHWTPPPGRPRRFATWFFATAAPAGAVTVDGGEIHDHAWLQPADALARRDAGTVELSPPTWITLWQLRAHTSAHDAVRALAARPPEHFATRMVPLDDHVVALYRGDAGYDDHDPARAGARHRLEMRADGWRYRRDPAPDDPDPAVP